VTQPDLANDNVRFQERIDIERCRRTDEQGIGQENVKIGRDGGHGTQLLL
jgi:hypothetical protein